jgi:hypothetical protein
MYPIHTTVSCAEAREMKLKFSVQLSPILAEIKAQPKCR